MVIVLFGQPNSGKTTLSESLKELTNSVCIDGDDLRNIFKNKDFSRSGRIKNLERASDIATYLNSLGLNVICSLVYPYKESRDYLRDLVPDSKWIYLTYDEIRGRENFHVPDFDEPEKDAMILNTSEFSIEDCVSKIMYFIDEKNSS